VIPDRRHVLISLLFDRMYTSVNWKQGAAGSDHRNLQYVAPPQLSAATRHALRALESLRPEGHDAPAAMHLARALLGLALEDLHRVGVLPSRARRTYHELREYMEENYHRPIDREHLAQRFDLHPNHVSRLFRRMAGEGFAAALRRLRLESAERMLRETDASVKEVALACGFASANYFGKVFRRHRGASPGAWR
jgi:AraC-like DNA-binding protein